jgi:hypothetical protein
VLAALDVDISPLEMEAAIQALVKRFDRNVLTVFCNDNSDINASGPAMPTRPRADRPPTASTTHAPIVCNHCGEGFESPQGMGSHKRWCAPGGTGRRDRDKRCPHCHMLYHMNGFNIHVRFCRDRMQGQRRLNFVNADDSDGTAVGVSAIIPFAVPLHSLHPS